MRNNQIILILVLLVMTGCAHVKMVAWEGNRYKFCTNQPSFVTGPEDFDKSASKQCGGSYQRVAGGSENIALGVHAPNDHRMCMIYECK